jgi:predicted thioesterase
MTSPSATAQNQATATTRVVVEPKDTVGALDPSMPQVASTPYLVTVAEFTCARLVKDQLETGQITVGTRVVIDHLGASKVGAEFGDQSRAAEQRKEPLPIFGRDRGRPAPCGQGRA